MCWRGWVSRTAETYTRSSLPPARRYECARALLRAGADPNFVNSAGDHTLFWAIDGAPGIHGAGLPPP
jgi:hypothetical protein